MAYTPKTNWQMNDTVMPEDMNNLGQYVLDISASADTTNTNVGNSTDTASATGATLFSLLKFVANKFVSVWTDAKAALLDTISQYIGAPSDTASQTGNTLFALTKYTANNMALGGGILRTYTRAISESAAGADIINYTKPIKIRRIYYSRTAQPGGWPEIHFDSVTVSTFTTLDTFPLSGQLIIRSLGDWAYAAPDYTGFAIRDLDIICRNSFRVHQGVQSGTPSSITIVYEDLGGGAI